MTLEQLNEALCATDHHVRLVSVQQPNGDSRAMYRWIYVYEPLFDRCSIISLIASAKEELGNRFIRQHGLDSEVPADKLETEWRSP